jgi:hypothetical protein
MRKKLPKSLIDFWHFKKRAKERFNVDISKSAYNEAIDFIQDTGKKHRVERKSISRSVYRIPVAGVVMNVVYSKSTKSLVTAFREPTRLVRRKSGSY